VSVTDCSRGFPMGFVHVYFRRLFLYAVIEMDIVYFKWVFGDL